MDKGILLYAGMDAGIFYFIGDLVWGFITPNYNYIKHAVSELIQSGAENRAFLSMFLFLHVSMIVAFSIGLLARFSFSQSGAIFIGSILLLAVGVSPISSSSFFPMDPVGAQSTFPDLMHLILVGIGVIVIFILMPLPGLGFSRLYERRTILGFTLICLAIIFLSGISSPVVIGRGIQVMGLTERLTGYTFYIWMFVLAFLLIKEQSAQRSLRL